MSENKKKNLELFVFVLTAAVHRSGSFKQWDTSAQDFSKTSRSENCCCARGHRKSTDLSSLMLDSVTRKTLQRYEVKLELHFPELEAIFQFF